MNWIFDHLQIVIAAAGAIAYWLNQRHQAKEAEKAPPPVEKTFTDPDLAERTRKIREEIQRKIEARARGYTQPEPTRPASLEAPPLLQPVSVPAAPSKKWDVQRQAEILEEQAALQEKLREAELMKASARRRIEFEQGTVSMPSISRSRARAAVLEDVRSPAALRRAFIMKEVLAPPVALRQ